MKQQIKIIPAVTLPVIKGRKYLLIIPGADISPELGKAIQAFFGGESPVFVLGPKDVNSVKIAEVMEEHGKN